MQPQPEDRRCEKARLTPRVGATYSVHASVHGHAQAIVLMPVPEVATAKR